MLLAVFKQLGHLPLGGHILKAQRPRYLQSLNLDLLAQIPSEAVNGIKPLVDCARGVVQILKCGLVALCRLGCYGSGVFKEILSTRDIAFDGVMGVGVLFDNPDRETVEDLLSHLVKCYTFV